MATDPDLARKAHLALIDLLWELRREERGVRQSGVPLNPFAVPGPQDTGIKTSENAPKQAPFRGVKPTKITREEGVSPAEAYVRSLGVDALMTQQVADELNISPQLVRKLRNNPSFKAPSMEVPFGTNVIYLYTPDDVAELRAYVMASRAPRPRST